MKKSTIILFAAFYLMVASGLTVSFHYCGGKLKYFSFFTSNNENGCCGNKKKSKGCCKDKTTFVKVKDNYQIGSNIVLPSSTSTELLFACNVIVNDYLTIPFCNLFAVPDSHAPPDILPCPTFLLNKSIRV